MFLFFCLHIFILGVIAFGVATEWLLIDETFMEFCFITLTVTWLFDEWLQEWEHKAFQKRNLIRKIFTFAILEWKELT